MSRHDRWDKGHQHQREILWQYLAARDRNSKAVHVKNVIAVFVIFVLVAVGTAFVIANEAGILHLGPTKEAIQ